MLKKIALEEHFLSPGLIEYWTPSVAAVDRTAADILFRRLTDFDTRLETMARSGIERAVLSLAGPGVQAEPVIATAVRKASEANDFLAREIRKRPQQFLGFAHLPMQDPTAAAAELERCVRELEFCGAFVHGADHGRYLDDPVFDALWERAEALNAPIYLHRGAAKSTGLDYRMLEQWEASFETSSHVLRLVYGGVFDRYPKARVIVGQLGDALPYMLAAFDAQARRDGSATGRPPSDYFRDNIFVTTSGLLATAPLYCAVAALGPTQVLFATSYPFGSAEDAAHFLDTVRLDEGLRADIAYRNAERLFEL